MKRWWLVELSAWVQHWNYWCIGVSCSPRLWRSTRLHRDKRQYCPVKDQKTRTERSQNCAKVVVRPFPLSLSLTTHIGSYTYTITEWKIVNGERVEKARPLSKREYEVRLMQWRQHVGEILGFAVCNRLSTGWSIQIMSRWLRPGGVSCGTDNTSNWTSIQRALKSMTICCTMHCTLQL